MKKAYLKDFKEQSYNDVVHINMDMHKKNLRPINMNDQDINHIKSNLLEDEFYDVDFKKIIVKGSTDLITIQKFIRPSTDTFIYLFTEHQNQLTIYSGATRYFIKEVKR